MSKHTKEMCQMLWQIKMQLNVAWGFQRSFTKEDTFEQAVGSDTDGVCWWSRDKVFEKGEEH